MVNQIAPSANTRDPPARPHPVKLPEPQAIIAMPPSRDLLLETPRFSVARLQATTPQGRSVQRDVVEHPGAVVIVPLVDDDSVCLIRNHRVSVATTLIELPAGTLEPNEPPSETARRELREETGFEAAHWQPLPWFFMSPGILNEKMFAFVARDLTPGTPQREPGEEIENLILPWEEALRLVDGGEIHDAKTLVGLMLADRQRRGLT